MSYKCTQHPNNPAAYRCDSCFTLRCRECVNDVNGTLTCTSCGQRAMPFGVSSEPASRRATGTQPSIPPPPPAATMYQGGQAQQVYGGSAAGTYQEAATSSAASSAKVPGWVWFVLVYGVGNFILYKTTGMLLLPIPRR